MAVQREFATTRPATCRCGRGFAAPYLGLGKYQRDCSETCRQERIFAARKGARPWRPGEQDAVVVAYEAGQSAKAIAREHGFGQGRIARLLADRGVPLRDSTAPKRYPWDPTRLGAETPEAAYFAGLLMADGNLRVSPRSARLTLVLQERDAETVHALCDFLGAPAGAVHTRTLTWGEPPRTGRYTRLVLSDPRLPAVLRPYGIVPRKSYEYAAPDVADPVLPAFLRGWFDGDGSLRPGTSNSSPRFSVCGHPEAMAWYRDALHRLGFAGHVGIEQRRDFSVVLSVVGRRQVARVRELLSRDDGPRLARKWDDFIPVRHTATTTQMGAILGVANRTVMQWADKGRIPSERAGRNRLFDPVEVLDHLGLTEADLRRRAGRLDVAAALGISPARVDGLRRRGVLPATVLPGLRDKWYRFDVAECRAMWVVAERGRPD